MNGELTLNRCNWGVSDTSSQSSAVVKFPPDYGEQHRTIIVSTDRLDDRAASALGENGIKRFKEFQQYKEGWDSGTGKPLSLRSVAVLEFFMNSFTGFPEEPSLFFTRDGNLQLGWEDASGKTVEFEFFPDQIEYYIEAKNTEGRINIDQRELKDIIAVLKEN